MSISEYTWLDCCKGADKEKTLKQCLLTDYFVTSNFSGNNRGDVANLSNTNNLTAFANLIKTIFDPDAKYDHIFKTSLVSISYQDITGKDAIKYYETSGAYFNHIDADKAKEKISELTKLPTILLKDLTIENLNKL